VGDDTDFSDGIRKIDELDLETVVFGEPSTKGTDTKPLGRVMTGGHVMDLVFGSLVKHPFGGLASDIGVETRGDSLVELALGTAGHDADRGNHSIATWENLRLTLTRLGDRCEKLVRIHRLRKYAAYSCRTAAVLAKGLELFETEATCQTSGIPQIEVTVERQVIGDERDSVLEENSNPLTERANDSRGLVRIPEDAVVHNYCVGPTVCSVYEELT